MASLRRARLRRCPCKDLIGRSTSAFLASPLRSACSQKRFLSRRLTRKHPETLVEPSFRNRSVYAKFTVTSEEAQRFCRSRWENVSFPRFSWSASSPLTSSNFPVIPVRSRCSVVHRRGRASASGERLRLPRRPGLVPSRALPLPERTAPSVGPWLQPGCPRRNKNKEVFLKSYNEILHLESGNNMCYGACTVC